MFIEALARLTEEERVLVVTEAFDKVASTEEGRIVFWIILNNLYLFKRAETPEHQALNNYAKALLKYFGGDAQQRAIQAILRS